MDSPTGSVRRGAHGRNPSYNEPRRIPMTRRSTKGPLDVDDVPAESVPSSPASSLPPLSAINTRLPQSPRPPSSLLSPVSVRSSPSRSPSRRPPFDLRFLQDPSLYHELPTQDIPKPFFDSDHQPPPDAPISDLLAPGHFRRAAIACLGQLLRARPLEPEDLLQLLYTRLACLILIARPDLAAQEALPLTDFLARNSPGARELLPLISWELRILLVRLQSIGAGDGGRRGIMALYALAAEVRANLKQAQEKQMKTEVEVMMGRLQDLGLRVADALVEMNEQEPAARHLKTLEHATEEQLAWRQALLWIRLGDIEGAHKCLDGLKSAEQKEVLSAMIAVANGEYEAAVSAWRSLCKQYPENEMVAQNLAVCLLYTGHIIEARELLQDRVDTSPVFPGLLFNLSTLYELCTERSVERKTQLAQRVASREPAPESGGWERANVEFKL